MSHGSIVGQRQGWKGDTGHSRLRDLLMAMLCFQKNVSKKTCQLVYQTVVHKHSKGMAIF